ncbi:MAG: hypothetical protein BGO63_15265 [Candidatus Accumulibacter sp. 66-26]|nr:MAG: hypothetical protein BGO63_15265 [Candidatus Accumulibacter sp. 66-26]
MHMKADYLQYAITALSNLLRSGISPDEALREMQFLQPRYKDFWRHAAYQAARGTGMATILRPLLDEAMYSAVNAAELSGTVITVLARLEQAMEEKKEMRKTLKSMGYPFAMLFGACGVMLLYLAFVVPAFSRSVAPNSGNTPSTLQIVGSTLNSVISTYWVHILVGVVAMVGAGLLWLRDPANRNSILALFDRVPLLGAAARDLFYGEWATHMAINTHAGITVLEAIRLTSNILPDYYRQEVLAVAKDITRLGQAEATTPRSDADIRKRIPFMIANAFRLSERTGVTDSNFETAARVLIAQGQMRIKLFVSTANNIATPAAALLGAGAMFPYFIQLTDTISQIR